MSKPHDLAGQPGPAPSRNPFVRFQQGFERGFNRFRERYALLLEQAIAQRQVFVTVSLVVAVASLSLFFFLGRDYFPEIRSGVIQMHMRAPLGTRIEVSGRIATLVSNSVEELLAGEVENIVSNCGLPVGAHNLAFIPTPTIGSQDCDLTILLRDEKSPVWDYRRILRKGLTERYPGTEFTFQPSDLTAKILNFGAPAPIDVQIKGPDMHPNYEFTRKLAGKLRQIPGATDVVIQQTMRTPTLMVEGNRTFGLAVNRTQKEMASNLLMTTAGSQQIDQVYWLDPKTGMSYLINVYTPQAQVNSVNSLRTIPVEPSSEAAGNNHDVQLLGNLADLIFDAGGITEALALYDDAVRRAPSNAQLRLNRALALLSKGDVEAGWRDYEWRLKIPGRIIERRGAPPRWDGLPRKGRTLLVMAEQGIGDQIAFAAFLPQLLEDGPVILECEPRLEPLLARSLPGAIVRGRPVRREGATLSADYDWADAALSVDLASLPHL